MFEGIFPPIPTPFINGQFSPDRLVENLSRWNTHPIDGYVVLGSNGEAPLLDDHESQAVVRTAYAAIPPERLLIVGAGRESTRATVRAVHEAFELGADAVLVGVPHYYKPMMSHEALRDHYLRVADSAEGPMLLYSVPAFTGLPIDAPLLEDLLAHERIVGIKDSSGNLEGLRSLLEAASRVDPAASVLVGSAGAFAEGLAAGASGGILAVACLASGILSNICRCAREGRPEEALRLNRELDPLAEAVTVRHGIGGLKAAMELVGFYGGDPRPPLRPASSEAREELASLLRNRGLMNGGDSE